MDGPPPYSVDVSKIPNATPKIEAQSRYGNQPYTVFGKKYNVLSSSKNYQERGIASWYGTKFHHRKTSSGERYNMLAMTAAHKSLPLPTYVEVTNLQNGKKVIVKVNDRGPFEGNRIIDLSYAAAKKIGMIGRGTANVEVKAINPAVLPVKTILANDFYIAKKGDAHDIVLADNHAPHKFASTTMYTKQHLNDHHIYLQVGAFQKKANAEKLRQQLIASIKSPINITTRPAKNPLYRVKIGPLKDATTVARINRQLKMMGITGTKTVV